MEKKILTALYQIIMYPIILGILSL